MGWGGVLDNGSGRYSANREALIRSAISRWRASIIDVAAANRLLSFKPGGTGMIEVVRPAADDILIRLKTGASFAFRSLTPWAGEARAVPPPAPYLLDTPKEPDDLEAALQALMRRSNQQSLERGLPVLYLAFGTLTWADRDRARYTSPLLLMPVRLAASEMRQPPMLEPTDDDPVINPALGLELSRDGITLPGVDELTHVTLSGLLDTVRAAVAAKDGWLVSDSVVLSCFPPMNEAMYRDLLDHEDLIAAHPAVRALAAGGLAGTRPGEITGPGAGPGTGLEAPPVILPADSSQRACVMAALAGRSFTIDGPPGTGKSQTIANIVGALLHAGKTVLVVSHKAAALDVAADRLTGAGLGGYLLELHSHKAARKEVAAALGLALDTAPTPVPPPDTAAALNPQQLKDYAHAVNRMREPLGFSLHDALAMIASMPAVPAAPATGLDPARLTPEAFGEIRRAAAAVAAAWRPAAQGQSFAWRGVTEQGGLDGRLYEAASALETLARVARGNQILADATGLTRPSDAPALAQLLDHLLTWPESLPDEWLTVDRLDVVDAAAAQLTAALTAIVARETQATQVTGIPWSSIPQRRALPATDDGALGELNPACADVSSLGAKQITEVARDLSAAADLLERWLDTLSRLAAALGLQPPVAFSNANDLLSLARLAGEPDRPERPWLSVPGYRAAGNAAQVLYDAHRALAEAEAAARTYFTPDALRQDAGGLAKRFVSDHHGLGRLSGAYRTDKKAVEAFTRPGVAEETALEHLGLAADWRQAAEALADAEFRHATLLGPYYAGRGTDFTRLERVLNHAANAIQWARGQDLSRAADYISRDTPANGALNAAVTKARQDLSAWQEALAPAPAIAPRPELMDGTIMAAIGWLRAHLGPLHAASEFTRAVGEVVGRPLTLDQARHLIALREAADTAHAQLAARDAIFRDLCGPQYAGVATDIRTLRDTLEWARRLRAIVTGGSGPLTPAHITAAESAVPTDRLAKAADAWQEASEALLRAFGQEHRQELAAGLDDYQNGYHLLEAMFDDPGGRDEWLAYQAASASLAAHGMGAAVDFCVAERIEAAQVPQVIERALLREWSDHQLRADPALAPLRAADRDALVSSYQRLDEAMTTAAAADVIRACNARRPRGETGESAVIRLEAAKKNGLLPVRELLGQTRHLTQAIKPCILTSPLAVSQYLPDGMSFDVVIFDEASQISSADAVNCIYRGTSVVLAGDHKQLPPASLSSALGDEDLWPAEFEDAASPESVLDVARQCREFGNIALRWHYRSQHEALIAFSNAAFYDGRLIAVPGGGPEAGIELFYGEGAYQSATTRDNPSEAERVARRIIHHYSTRPALSLGVVAFSEAQAGAIEAALGEARKPHHGLDRFFGTDRLHGFFVKNADAAQGDERDVLILSIGYGPDENGQLTSDLGSLGRPDGWRRLNVAATRARYRAEVVTSIRAGDIPESATAEGLRHLRRYLSYAESGLTGVPEE
jgi:hypothetical protein